MAAGSRIFRVFCMGYNLDFYNFRNAENTELIIATYTAPRLFRFVFLSPLRIVYDE